MSIESEAEKLKKELEEEARQRGLKDAVFSVVVQNPGTSLEKIVVKKEKDCDEVYYRVGIGGEK